MYRMQIFVSLYSICLLYRLPGRFITYASEKLSNKTKQKNPTVYVYNIDSAYTGIHKCNQGCILYLRSFFISTNLNCISSFSFRNAVPPPTYLFVKPAALDGAAVELAADKPTAGAAPTAEATSTIGAQLTAGAAPSAGAGPTAGTPPTAGAAPTAVAAPTAGAPLPALAIPVGVAVTWASLPAAAFARVPLSADTVHGGFALPNAGVAPSAQLSPSARLPLIADTFLDGPAAPNVDILTSADDPSPARAPQNAGTMIDSPAINPAEVEPTAGVIPALVQVSESTVTSSTTAAAAAAHHHHAGYSHFVEVTADPKEVHLRQSKHANVKVLHVIHEKW